MSSHRTKDKTRVEIPNQVLTDLQRAANRKHITVTAYISLNAVCGECRKPFERQGV